MTAIIFPGQGSQYVNMSMDFNENFDVAKKVFQEIEDITQINIRKIITENPSNNLNKTNYTQISIFSASMAMPLIVFITESASVPDSMQACALFLISLWFGESFVMIGLEVAFLHAETTPAVIIGSFPNSIPPFFTFGQDIFSSIPATFEESKRLVISTYSLIDDPDTLAK